ncbi:hypothetical protein HK405_013308 [Cladochytrium tenue]|nr:hypothetical protein HK405_013308 [Cladochytrium tenue]
MMNPLEDDAYGFHSDSGGGSGAGLSHGDDPLLSPARANSGGGSSSLGGGGITTPPAAAPLAFDTPFADHDHDADLHASATVGGSVFDSTVDGFGRYSSSSSFEQDASGHHDDDEEAGEAEPHRDEDRPRLAPTAGPLTGNPFLQTRQVL